MGFFGGEVYMLREGELSVPRYNMVNRLGIVHCALLLHVASISVELQQQQQQQHGDISLSQSHLHDHLHHISHRSAICHSGIPRS